MNQQLRICDNTNSISLEPYKQLMQLLSKNNNEYVRFNFVITDNAIYTASDYIDSSSEHISYIFNVIDYSKQESTSWVIDSGGPNHIFSYRSMSSSLITFTRPYLIGLPNGQLLYVSHNGSVSFKTPPCCPSSICFKIQTQSHFRFQITSQPKVWVTFTN